MLLNQEIHSLFEAIMDSAVLLDKAGRIIDWNQGATALFGYSKKEVLGRSINLIYAQNHPFQKIIQDLPQQKKWTIETGFIRKNGIKGFCKLAVTSLSAQQNHKPLILATHYNISPYKNTISELQENSEKLGRDLSEQIDSLFLANALLIKNIALQEQMDRILRDSELRFHLLAENATDIISRHSADGRYVYISPSCKTLLGYSPEELIGISAYRYLHHDDIGRLKKAFNRRKKHPTSMITYRMRRKEGDYRWFESNIRIIHDEQTGMIKEIQSASRDVTDRIMDKKARLRGQQLAHVFRLSTMEEMASGMAHEISQPLAAIVNYTRGCVRYLQKGHHDITQLTEIMEKAVAQAERAGEVIHHLKNFFAKGQLFKTPCKINSVIRETVSFIRNDLTASKTKIDFNLAKDVPLISADKIQVQQVILNLIQNAIDAMRETDPQKRRILIQTKPLDKNTIEVTFSDSGPGFSKDMVNKAFKPFFTTKANGRGMGLAICRSIIDAHGGLFTINPNTNHHSWIRFTLPIN